MKTLTIALVLSAAAAHAAPDFSHAPAIPAAGRWRPPVPAAEKTTDGLRVMALKDTNLPLVHFVAVVAAGSELDPESKPGLAKAVADMLEEGGAGARTREQLADALADLGAELMVHVDQNGARFVLSAASRNFDVALGLMSDLLARPKLEAKEWTREREAQIANVIKERAEPRRVADWAFERAIFGDHHPYAHPVIGTEAGFKAIGATDLRAFYSAHYGPRTTTMVLIGDVPDGAVAKVSHAFAGWKSAATPPPPPKAASRGTARIVVVDRPGAPQSEVRVGHIGVPAATPDFAGLNLLETVLGGSFTSRLNQNLREKHGYTYGAHAQFKPLRAPGVFEAAAAVRTDVTAPAIKEIISELNSIVNGPTDEEVQKGRSLVLSSVVEAFSQGFVSAVFLGDLILNDLPIDRWNKALDELDKLDSRTLTAISKRLFFPKDLVIVVVGDWKAIEGGIKALGYGVTLAPLNSL